MIIVLHVVNMVDCQRCLSRPVFRLVSPFPFMAIPSLFVTVDRTVQNNRSSKDRKAKGHRGDKILFGATCARLRRIIVLYFE